MRKHWKIILILLVEVVLVWNQGVIPQNQEYHNFADVRTFWGIPNFFDVVSNLPFIFFGGWGVIEVFKNYSKIPYALSWLFLFIGVLLVAPGSMYYHWNPNDVTLVWDRLPMTIGFMALLVGVFSLYFPNRYEKLLLPFAIFLGFGSIYYWVNFGDLRIYYIVQLTAIIIIPLLTILYKNPKVNVKYLIGAFLFYFAAKLTETFDDQIFVFSPLSGHTIKHVLAAFAVGCFVKLNQALQSE